MGTATLTNITKHHIGGGLKMVKATLTMSNSYATGGDDLNPLTAAGVNLNSIDSVEIDNGIGGYGLVFTGNKVLAYNGTTQISNATDLNTVVAVIKIYGR